MRDLGQSVELLLRERKGQRADTFNRDLGWGQLPGRGEAGVRMANIPKARGQLVRWGARPLRPSRGSFYAFPSVCASHRRAMKVDSSPS